MYLSKLEREKIIAAYDCEGLVESDHYQVEPDTWVYLFRDKNEKKYVLIDADYLDFDFEVYLSVFRLFFLFFLTHLLSSFFVVLRS